jgi:integral membrane protein (TIGR01906 family)
MEKRMNKTVTNIIQWLVILAMPFFLGLGSIQLIIAAAPAYLTYEYNKPDFPPDPYGFTTQHREELAIVAVRYLQRREPAEEVIFLLEEQQLPDGSGPLYNASEIGHMLDVKNVTDAVGRIWLVAAVIVVGGLVVLLFRPDTRPAGYRAILGGGIATTVVLLFIALFILLAWNVFFVQFHELLFPPETWTFRFDESLIRLFPEKFWFDIGVIMSMLPLLAGILTAILGYILVRRGNGE